MQSENLLHINLAHADEAAKRLDIELTDRFFADLEQEEISGGDVHARIIVKASAGNIYKVSISVKGQVIVPCDRCLDPLTIDIEASDTVNIKDGDEEDGDAAEMLYTIKGTSDFDLSWIVYEIIETSLPIQRVHPDDECNSEMLSYITKEEPEQD